MCKYCNNEMAKEILREREMAVIHLREEGKKFREIAQMFKVSDSRVQQLVAKGYRKLANPDIILNAKNMRMEKERKQLEKQIKKNQRRNQSRLKLMEELISRGIFTDYKGEYARLKGAACLDEKQCEGIVIGRKWKILCPKCEATGEVEFNEYVPMGARADLHIKCHRCGYLISDIYFKEESNG